MANLLEINKFSVTYSRDKGSFKALENIDFSVKNGDSIGIVGESGSGKSTLALGIMGLLAFLGAKTSGEIFFHKKSLHNLSKVALRKIRGEKLSMIFQNPWSALDPLYTIGDQFIEFLKAHQCIGSEKIDAIINTSLLRSQLPSDISFQRLYPHQLSGGMLQRVSIAMSTALHPELLVADEPTSNLDVSTQAQIISLLKKLRSEYNMSLVFISHDLALVSQLCDRIYILKNGRIIESGLIKDIFLHPKDSYTKKLIESIPRVQF